MLPVLQLHLRDPLHFLFPHADRFQLFREDAPGDHHRHLRSGLHSQFGHRAGDLAISTISRKISECIRNVDIAARYGGDEFAVILPNTSLVDAVTVAERMVAAVADTRITFEQEPLALSISAGVGQYDSSFGPEDITSKSDEALYHAKKAGKNRVHILYNSAVNN